MTKSVLSAKHFHDEEAAYAFVEKRLWPEGPICPHCGGVERISKMQGKSTRIGLYKCYQCRKPFRVTVGPSSRRATSRCTSGCRAIALLSASKKGISSNQLHRTLGITLKAAWFMSHRIREAMRDGVLAPMGGIVEADETYLWKTSSRSRVLAAVARAVPSPRAARAARPTSARSSRWSSAAAPSVPSMSRTPTRRPSPSSSPRTSPAKLGCMTDESRIYGDAAGMVASHESVKHSAGEYVRGDVHTNSVEGYFSIFKRGMKGVYQQCAEKHLHRYLAEFDFRYNNRVALGVDDRRARRRGAPRRCRKAPHLSNN